MSPRDVMQNRNLLTFTLNLIFQTNLTKVTNRFKVPLLASVKTPT